MNNVLSHHSQQTILYYHAFTKLEYNEFQRLKKKFLPKAQLLGQSFISIKKRIKLFLAS